MPTRPWVAAAPALVMVRSNNRRQRQLHRWRGHPFANDHLGAFFNAAVEGAIVLAAFVLVAEAAGLRACPISGLRDRPYAVAELLGLPDHVFPVAGAGLAYPAAEPPISLRLPLTVTMHDNRWSGTNIETRVAD